MKQVAKTTLGLAMAGMMALAPSASYALSQNETVYAKLQPTGESKYISVTKQLVNDEKAAQISDQATLTDIENLNGFESFRSENGKVRWEAAGKDIYYRGTSNQELPVKLDISYRLDGKVVTLDEALGKAGKVEIHLHYTNLSKVGQMYTPFVAAVTTTLKADAVSNVAVSNGKAISNGRTIAIAAVAAPGLYESLGIAELEHADEVVISFETQKFELGDIYTIVTPKLLDNADLQVFSELDDLYADANKLSVSSKQLADGAKTLRSGVSELRSAVAGAKAKMTIPENLLSADMLGQIRTAAGSAAEKQAAMQEATIRASVKQQVEGNAIMMNAFKLQATEMCQANPQTASMCGNAAVIQQIQTQLAQGIEDALVQSSLELAKTTARETASATATNVATQIANTIQGQLGNTLSTAFDSMLGGIDKVLLGADELAAGMEKFNNEGIQPLANFVNGQVKTTASKIEQLVKLAQEYDNYADKPGNIKSETKFIMMVEAQKVK